MSVFACALAAALLAADNPFAGTWKLNTEKSNLTGDTITFTSEGSGAIKFSVGSFSYTFKADGKERAGLIGEIVSWKAIDDHTWEETEKANGKLIATDTIKLSDDGKTLDIKTAGTHANGESYQDEATYERTSGDSGIIGTWKSTKVQGGSPEVIELKAYGADGLTFYSPSDKFTFNAKFDGKPYPATGPTIPPGASGTLRRTGPLSFELAEIYKSKPFWKGTYTVSEDKSTLTVVGAMAGANESQTYVYDRQ